MHYYFYYRIKVDFKFSNNHKIILIIIISILFLLFFIGEISKRVINNNILIFFGQLWFGTLCIAMTFLILKDIILLFINNYKNQIILSTYIFLVFTLILASWNASKLPIIREITLKNNKVPKKLLGFTIIQLSDLHIKKSTSLNELEDLVEMVNKLKPDLIVITGDILDTRYNEIISACDILKNLQAKYGVYTVTGNHEYYVGIKDFIEFNEYAGFKILSNENVLIANDIQLAGINDSTSKNFNPEFSTDLDKTLKGIDKSKMTIFLSHQPFYFKEASERGVDLQLSGHIHKGQLPPAFPLVYLFFKYPYGLYQYKNSYIYTTSGTLTWGPSMRLFSKNEIVKIILQRGLR